VQLGGKDPAYVREDADLAYTVPELVDGKHTNVPFECAISLTS
jgi:acyl-CoA reductase-like NAD-dependent aldehyde dehydrogenase